MEIDRKRLLADIKKTKYYLQRHLNQSTLSSYLKDYDFLLDLYYDLTGEEVDKNNYFFGNREFYNRVNKVDNRCYSDFETFIMNNKDIINAMFSNYDALLDSLDYQPFAWNYDIKKYSDEEVKDIILSFYSTYGNDIYKTVKKYFDEGRIQTGFITKDDESAYAGVHLKEKYSKSGYICVADKTNDAILLKNLAHELGHALEADKFIYPQQKKFEIFSDALVEVPSTTFEYAFIHYLKDKHIETGYANVLFNILYYENYFLSDEVKTMLDLDYLDFDDNGGLNNNVIDGEPYPLRDILIYGLGFFYALNLYILKRDNPSEFNKLFFDMISTRCEVKDLETTIERLGFDVDKFVKFDYIKDEIVKNDRALKKHGPKSGY